MILKVLYEVTGTDHDGYCSGRDGVEDGDDVEYLKLVRVDVNRMPLYLSELDTEDIGCTNERGSHYCTNFRRRYTALISVRDEGALNSFLKIPKIVSESETLHLTLPVKV